MCLPQRRHCASLACDWIVGWPMDWSGCERMQRVAHVSHTHLVHLQRDVLVEVEAQAVAVLLCEAACGGQQSSLPRRGTPTHPCRLRSSKYLAASC
jgi:hypothetical protein